MAKVLEGKWTKEEMKDLLERYDKVLYGALEALYNEQTSDEQSSGDTMYHNGVGFNGADAKVLTSIAKYYKEHQSLSDKQKALVRKRLKKYIGQITNLANQQYAIKHPEL